MTDIKRLRNLLLAVQAHHTFGSPEHQTCNEIDSILSALAAVRRECDFGPLRELNDGRPDVLCLDFTGPADTLRDLAELLGGGK